MDGNGTCTRATGRASPPPAPPEAAEPLSEHFCDALAQVGVHVERGVFGARTRLELVNDGSLTIVLG